MASKSRKLLSHTEIAGFCTQMAMVLNAGISTYAGISALLDCTEDEQSKEILEEIFSDLEKGGNFSDALSHTGVFPKYILDMIRVGEQTGKLEDVLRSLADYCEREHTIRQAVRHAVTYPFVMIAMMLAIIIVLVTKVLPLFQQVYNELGSGLTGFSYALMQFSEWFGRLLLPILAVIIVVLLCVFLFLRSAKGKRFLKRKELGMQIAISRFANCLALALGSGLDTDQGLDMAKELVDNPILEEKIDACKKQIAQGTGFDKALISSGIFTGIYNSMILIGYKTGSMDRIMKKIAADYEVSTDEKIANKISRLEPTLVIILSVIVGLLLLAFLLPLLGIMNNIG